MAGETLVEGIYILIGYTEFLFIEKRSTIEGRWTRSEMKPYLKKTPEDNIIF